MRGIQRNVVVVESAERIVIIRGILDNHLLCHLCDCGSHTETCAENYLAIWTHLGGFDDGDVDVSVETIAKVLRQMAEVHVEIIDVTVVDGCPCVLMSLIRSPDGNGIGSRQLTVYMIVSRCTRKDVDFEGDAFFMELFGTLCKSDCHYFWSTGCGKARKTDIIAVFNVARGFFCRNKRDTHL